MSLPVVTFDVSPDNLSTADQRRLTQALAWWNERNADLPQRLVKPAEAVFAQAGEWRLPLAARLAPLAAALIQAGGASDEAHNPFDDRTLATAHRFLQLDAPLLARQEPEPVQRAARAARLRELFYTAYTDLDAALLALAAHTVRMGQVEVAEKRAMRRLCEENEAIYLPLLELLGMWQLRRNLGDLSLRLLNPNHAWERIEEARQRAIGEQRDPAGVIQNQATSALTNAGLAVRLSPHPTSSSSFYRRTRRGESLGALTPVIKFDLTLPDEAGCYRALQVIHKLWTPLAGRSLLGGYFQDQIANPKHTGYRALITSVAVPLEGTPGETRRVEFRILTPEMETGNYQGVLAYRYLPAAPIRVKNAWWEDRSLCDWLAAHPPGSPGPDVYVFSPVGKVIRRLPAGSTPIDYAYRIHSEVGHHCKRIYINGKPGSHRQKLENGDLVEIMVDPAYPGPDPRWLEAAKTNTAKRAIQKALARSQPPRGRRILQTVIRQAVANYGLERELTDEEIQRFLEENCRYYGYSDLNALYLDIAEPEQTAERRPPSPNQLAARLVHRKLAGHLCRSDGQPLGVPLERVRFFECAQHPDKRFVTSSEAVVGRLVKPGAGAETLIVYRRDCPAAAAIPDPISLEWIGNFRPGKQMQVSLRAVDRPFLMEQVLKPIYELYPRELYVIGFAAAVAPDRLAMLTITIQAPAYEVLEALNARLAGLKETGVILEYTWQALSPIERLRLVHPDQPANPYTSGPVFDRRLFKGRESELRNIDYLLRGEQNALVLYGISRVGKTSLLRFIKATAGEQGHFLPVYLDLQSVTEHTQDRFWISLADMIAGEVERFTGRHLTRLHPHSGRLRGNVYANFLEWLPSILDALVERRLLVMIDEFNLVEELWRDEQEARQFVARLKALTEDEPRLKFIFCYQENLYRQVLSPGARLISAPLVRSCRGLRLEFLDAAAAENLIRQPMGDFLAFDATLVSELLRLTAGHPYYLQNLLQALVEYGGRRPERRLTLADLEAVLPGLLANGLQLFHYFLQYHAGDRGLPLPSVLSALAHLNVERTQPAAPAELQTLLEQQRVRIPLEPLVDALEYLRDAGVVERRLESNRARYTLRLPMLASWLVQERPLSLIQPYTWRERRAK